MMKTAFFYAVRELKRRFVHFIGIFLALGTAVYIPVTLYGFTEARRGNGFNEQFFFLFGVISAIVFGLTVMMLADKYDKFSEDYRMLVRFGMPQKRLMLIQLIEATVIFVLSSAVFYPLSLASLFMIFSRYNSRLDEIPWIFEERFAGFGLPGRIHMPEFGADMLGLIAVLYAVLVFAVAAAYCSAKKTNRLSGDIRMKNGGLYGEERLMKQNDLPAYAAAVSGRMKRKLKHTGKTAVLGLLVPVVMLCGAMTSGTVRHSSDIIIMSDSVHNPIPQSVFEKLGSMNGIKTLDAVYHERNDGEQIIHIIEIILEEDNFHETALEIGRLPELSAFEVRINCFSEISTIAAYRMNREYFLLAAVSAFFSGLVSLGFQMNDCLALRREEMRILKRLGLEENKRIMLGIQGNMAMYLPAVLFTAGLGLVLYLGMSVFGGDRLSIGEIVLAAAVIAVMTALTALISLLTAIHAQHSERMERR